MGIFNNNKKSNNEKSGLISIIKNERENEELIWKSPIEDFYINSQVIVMESEEALFVKDGVIVETLGAGKHTLTTEIYPFINKLQKMVTGGVNMYSAKIYFVDKAHKLELLWGTDSPIQMRDAQYGFAVGVRARGSYSIQIKDSKKFFVKLVGNVDTYTKEQLQSKFRTAFQMKIKNTVAKIMKESNLTILDMNTELERLGSAVEKSLSDILDEYGIRLVNFYISDISIPENDPNYATINASYAKAHAQNIEKNIEGENWEKFTQKEIMKDIANNPNGGGAASVGAGLGMGIAFANSFGNFANQMVNNQSNSQTNANQNANAQAKSNTQEQQSTNQQSPKEKSNKKQENKNQEFVECKNCHTQLPKGTKFCSNCGTKVEKQEYICKKCGEKLSPNAKFCPNCGTKRED